MLRQLFQPVRRDCCLVSSSYRSASSRTNFPISELGLSNRAKMASIKSVAELVPLRYAEIWVRNWESFVWSFLSSVPARDITAWCRKARACSCGVVFGVGWAVWVRDRLSTGGSSFLGGPVLGGGRGAGTACVSWPPKFLLDID